MARRLEVELVGDSRSLERAFARSARSAKQFDRAMRNVNRAAGVFGLSVGVVGVTRALQDVVTGAIDFERSMRNVNSIARLSEAEFSNLSQRVLELAGPLAQSPDTLAKGLYDIQSSGFAADEGVKVLTASAKAATAGLTETSVAAKAIAAALNAYHLSADQAQRVSDVLFSVVDKGVITFEELSQNMGDLVPAAAPLGVTLEEVGAAMSTITLQGVPAAEAATRVKNTMLQLAKPSVGLAKLIRQIGFESGEAAVASLGFAGVLEAIDKATGGSVGATAKLSTEMRALLGTVGLTGRNLSTYQTHLDAMNRAQEGAGRTAEAFTEQSKSAGVQLQRLSANVDSLKIAVGTLLIPQLVRATDATNEWLGKPGNRERVINDTAAAVRGLAGAYETLAAAIQTVKDVQGTRGDLKDMLGPFGFMLSGPVEGFRMFEKAHQQFLKNLGLPYKYPDPKAVRPTGLLGSRAADAATRAAGSPYAASAMADAATRAAAIAKMSAATADVAGGKRDPLTKQRKGVSVTQRNAWFDAMISRQLGRVQDITSLKGQAARLGQIAGLIRARMAATKDVTRRLALEDTLLEVLRTQRATRKQRTEEIQQLAVDARDERLAWLDFAIEKAEDTKTLKDNRLALRDKEKFWANIVRHEKKNREAVIELWRVRKQIRDLNKKNSDADPLAGLFQVSSKRMVQMLAAGTRLDAAGRHRLSANVSGMELRPINVGVHIDGREVGRANTKDQARTSRRTSRQTSGYRG